MEFNWDREKAGTNLRKHEVSFDEAVTVFHDRLAATFDDPDHSAGEERFITIGYSSQNRVVVAAHTERGDSVRIINARLATPQERKRHKT